jgi:Smg protein
MKESVLDILIYLFENYFDADLDSAPEPDRDTLKDELERAGFSEREVDRALEWLEQLSADPQRAGSVPTPRAMRIFDPSEQARLDTDCRGYILYLENIGILNASQRELVIDRLLALDARQIDIEQVKWVVLMVLFSQPGQENAYLRMEPPAGPRSAVASRSTGRCATTATRCWPPPRS